MTEITDRDPSEMSHDELREEWQETWERELSHSSLDGDEREELWERRQALWREMESRVDVEYPECPKCDGQRWAQSPGDPKHCSDCGYELGQQDMNIVEEIDDTWQQVTAGAQGEA